MHVLQDKHLGDGLYASCDGWQIELYAHNGLRKTNRVFLDYSTLNAFLAYAARATEKASDDA
jgi:hypothetical protein